jgi:hypothetical protein
MKGRGWKNPSGIGFALVQWVTRMHLSLWNQVTKTCTKGQGSWNALVREWLTHRLEGIVPIVVRNAMSVLHIENSSCLLIICHLDPALQICVEVEVHVLNFWKYGENMKVGWGDQWVLDHLLYRSFGIDKKCGKYRGFGILTIIGSCLCNVLPQIVVVCTGLFQHPV